MTRRYLLFFILLVIAGCVEPFDPEIDSYEDVLVVDGIVSNEEIAARVRLSRTYSYDQNRSNPETNALVIISDDQGNNYELEEYDDGYYTYSGEDLKPEAGQFFSIYILTADGLEFGSDYEEMLEVPEMDTVYFKDFRTNTAESYLNREGVEFYVTTRADEDNSRYYKWEWEESWKILPPINYPDVRYCWQFGQSRGVNIATTENLSENVLENQFIFGVPFTTNKLAIEYSLLIKQYAVTRDNYVYLTKLEKINEGSGGFFDPIPAALTGNLICITDPEIPVLGFFEASSVKSERLFIDRSELKYGYVATGFEDCEIIYVSFSEYSEGNIRDFYYVYEYFDSALDDTIVVMSNLRKCYDCSFVGDVRKPVYWND
jgi:hypothetical protein